MPDSYPIAAWRFEQIAPLIDASLSPEARRLAVRERTHKKVSWPLNEARERRGLAAINKPIPKSTLYRWLNAYRREGYQGLLPKFRSDRGAPRRTDTTTWVSYAVALLYEQPERSLTQLDVYLHAQFEDYNLGRSTLSRALNAHPAFPGIEALRKGKRNKARDRYEAQTPHEGWQLDAKGPFKVNFKDGTRVNVHVFSIIDDYSRAILAVFVSRHVDTHAAIAVFERAVNTWGLPDRFQFDLGGAFESDIFRQGLAQLGIHRNAVKPRTPQWQGKIEAYHRSLGRWFIDELRAQEVVNLDHLQQLLEAMIALIYQRHRHRSIGTTPEKRLAGRLSSRQVRPHDLERAFLLTLRVVSDPKTGEVRLPNGHFRVPKPSAGGKQRFRYHPFRPHAVWVRGDGYEIALEPFRIKPLSEVPVKTPPRGVGQLQRLADQFHGREKPNAQPGFGLPEVFDEIATLLGRPVPDNEREARTILAFYNQHGPLPGEPFAKACKRAAKSLGKDRPLKAYLDYLQREIVAAQTKTHANPESGLSDSSSSTPPK